MHIHVHHICIHILPQNIPKYAQILKFKSNYKIDGLNNVRELIKSKIKQCNINEHDIIINLNKLFFDKAEVPEIKTRIVPEFAN